MKSDYELVKELMEKAYAIDHTGSLKNLRQALANTRFSSPKEEQRAKELVGVAHMLCVETVDHCLHYAFTLFWQAHNKQMSHLAWERALKGGYVYDVWQMMQYANQEQIDEVLSIDLTQWLIETGVWWLRVWHNPKAGIVFFDEDDFEALINLVDAFYPDSSVFWSSVAKLMKGRVNLDENRRNLLTLAVAGENPVARANANDQDIDSQFRAYCKKRGVVVLKILQRGIKRARSCSWVYLVWDADGIVKVYKEVPSRNNGPWGNVFDSEEDLYNKLGSTPHFPHCYGVVEIAGTRFIRLSTHFGKNLGDLFNTSGLSTEQSAEILFQTSSIVAFAHRKSVAILDVKPENFLWSQQAKALDLGDSAVAKGNQEVVVYIQDPRFVTPEVAFRGTEGKEADVFKLGIMYHMLRTGQHPFDFVPFAIDDNFDTLRESAIIRYGWASTVVSYSSLPNRLVGKEGRLVERMLASESEKRPSAASVVRSLKRFERQMPVFPNSRQVRQKTRNIVLFPARMGVPHKGHIEYIARISSLGYYCLISINWAYQISERDPIQKHLVMKMVAQSLIERGFKPEEDFSFIIMPYSLAQTVEEYVQYYLSAPYAEDIVAVASGNSSVHRLLGSYWPVFDQKSVFGVEGKRWQDRSWGEHLRFAIRSGNYQKFCEYAASGVEQILSFEELQQVYGTPAIEVPNSVNAVLLDSIGVEIARGRVFRYSSPEESLMLHYASKYGTTAKLLDPFVRNTVAELAGKRVEIEFVGTEYNKETGEEVLLFQIL